MSQEVNKLKSFIQQMEAWDVVPVPEAQLCRHFIEAGRDEVNTCYEPAG
jgi:hypothetical protein